jgi:hypothetical protein
MEQKFEELAKEIKDIKNILSEIHALNSARIEREIRTNIDLESLKKVVSGNGECIGLKTEVSILKKEVARIYWLGGIIIIALIGNFMAMWFR